MSEHGTVAQEAPDTRDGPARNDELLTVAALAQRLRENIGRVIVGKDRVIELVLVALLSEGHILLEDVPGLGKTVLARSVARSLGCSFKRIQFTPDLIPTDITGITFYNQRSGEFEFRPGPIVAQIVLADEINRATPRTQSALLEAMEERQLTTEGVTLQLPSPFLVIATQNPVELEGTFPLPEAQLDRFLLRLSLGYPSEREERAILDRFEAANPLADLTEVASAEELTAAARAMTAVHCEGIVRDYIVKIVQATRSHTGLELGASPRASLALFRASRALAAVRGRPYVVPDDVKALAPAVLPHRLILSSSARLRGRDAAGIVDEVLGSVPAPVLE
ncbi:MAG TPA: MoxR family ATPase [Dehalococcoidia bacterium]|nr:MoxR family ATPase [Dehalococcoidia bacterium]